MLFFFFVPKHEISSSCIKNNEFLLLAWKTNFLKLFKYLKCIILYVFWILRNINKSLFVKDFSFSVFCNICFYIQQNFVLLHSYIVTCFFLDTFYKLFFNPFCFSWYLTDEFLNIFKMWEIFFKKNMLFKKHFISLLLSTFWIFFFLFFFFHDIYNCE